MKLLYQTHSPYARKALVFAHEAGLAPQIEVVHHETSPTRRNDHVFAENPLGKVPVLIRSGQRPIFGTCTDTNGPSANIFKRPDGIVDEKVKGDPGYWDPNDARPWATHYASGEKGTGAKPAR